MRPHEQVYGVLGDLLGAADLQTYGAVPHSRSLGCGSSCWAAGAGRELAGNAGSDLHLDWLDQLLVQHADADAEERCMKKRG